MESTVPAAAPAPPPWREVFRGTQGRLLVGLLLLETLFALHFLTVATVMPAVLDDLGNIALFGWVAIAGNLGQFAAIPIAGAAVDRRGPRLVLLVIAVLYTAGLLVSALAPTMLVVVAGRFLQGLAAGGGYALSLGTIAKALPERHRARVLALLATSWMLPGLLGPPIGGLLASTVGWRWAFVMPMPVLLVCLVLILPALGEFARDATTQIRLGRPLILMVAAGAFFAALTWPSPGLIAIGAVGLVVSVVALAGLVPPGTFRAARGPAAAAVAAFLLSVTFAAADYYLPLMFTDVLGRTLQEVSLVIAITPFSWAAGSWWQSRQVPGTRLGRLFAIGLVFVGVGFGATAIGLVDSVVPLWVPYAGWIVATVGMGIAFPIPPLSVMATAEAGKEGSDLSPTLLLDMLGVALGAGLGGAWLAFSDRAGLDLAVGIAGSFVVAGVALVLAFVVAPRLPDAD
ncbi:MAG TPA: MFS transporter [Actinomycetota bacterium]